MCLDEPEVFRPQIRAVLRAAVGRDLQFMLPLVTRVEEVIEAQAIVQEEAEALKAAGVRAAETVPVGVMVETPAAVLIADRLAEVSAFFSVGTNDLTQYTMAVDRGNARLADRFTPHHPSIVRQLHRVVEVGRAAGIAGERLRRDGLRAAQRGAPDRARLRAPQRLTAGAPAGQVGGAHGAGRGRPPGGDIALAASSAEEVSAALRETVGEFIDVRLLDPSSALPGRGRVGSLRPQCARSAPRVPPHPSRTLWRLPNATSSPPSP